MYKKTITVLKKQATYIVTLMTVNKYELLLMTVKKIWIAINDCKKNKNCH